MTHLNVEQILSEPQILIDFYADWCGPCKAIAPTVAAFDENNADVKVLKVDVDQHPELASTYQVRSIPTLVALKNGLVTDRKIGIVSEEDLSTMFH